MTSLRTLALITAWTAMAPADLLAQNAATQPVPGSVPAVVYLLPDGSAPAGRAAPLYAQPGMTAVPAAEIAQQYSCVIRLDADGEAVNTTFGAVHDAQSAVALLTSTAMVDPVVNQVLGPRPQRRRDAVVVNVFTAGQRLARVEVILRTADGETYAPDAAAKLTDALIARLKVAYVASSAAARKAAADHRAAIETPLQAAQAKFDELRRREREIRVAAALANVNPGSDVAAQIGTLMGQRKSLENDLRRNRARLQSMDAGSGPLIAQWTEIVSVRQKRLDDLTKAAAAAESPTKAGQVREARADLAEAKAQLEQASQLPDERANEARQRNIERANLRASVAEQADRMKQLDDQLAKLQEPTFQALLEQLPEVQAAQGPLRNQISELQNRLQQLRRNAREEGGVTITVLDGK